MSIVDIGNSTKEGFPIPGNNMINLQRMDELGILTTSKEKNDDGTWEHRCWE
jgi:hypothetical protein